MSWLLKIFFNHRIVALFKTSVLKETEIMKSQNWLKSHQREMQGSMLSKMKPKLFQTLKIILKQYLSSIMKNYTY